MTDSIHNPETTHQVTQPAVRHLNLVDQLAGQETQKPRSTAESAQERLNAAKESLLNSGQSVLDLRSGNGPQVPQPVDYNLDLAA